MNRAFHAPVTGRWAVIVAGVFGRYWQYAAKPKTHGEPLLLPNESSAKAYAAWLEDWAKQRPTYADSNVKFTAINLDTVDWDAIPLMWEAALHDLREVSRESEPTGSVSTAYSI